MLMAGGLGPNLGFPFNVPAIRALSGKALDLGSPVTFFVGENGSGKSTLLEALAVAAHSITVGSFMADDDPSLRGAQNLRREMKLIWNGKRTQRGFYMRAEDFFGFAREIDGKRREFEQEIEAIRLDPDLSEEARRLAMMPYAGQAKALRASYDEGLDARSHGESFLTLFQRRIVPDGLFLLDEPEAPLSPRRQLAFLALMLDAVRIDNAQFVIATHSPILMAFPGATIYSFDGGEVRSVRYDELDHVVITRDFLANPESFLRHLR
jgi:predicted ATPase